MKKEIIGNYNPAKLNWDDELAQNYLHISEILKRTTQSEIIIWHKYPEAKPTKTNCYFVTFIDGGVDFWTYDIAWSPPMWYEPDSCGARELDFKVIAWAEMPKGWRTK